ncbi:hypothetical protein DICPUDRAFT_83855 [Dictyostelium purpureum]|uniref:Methyltransferase type 12 domain-containing protein n=1 Tax=Dictyostelium purpureum TaxID=5786 RepID=F1A0U5_DICPU|nr:uncharacterized protein DICPUDRAFT_83855 [Dictyostelium purpureum]EGC30182.1 hypothetical protein DICPUDRAFT_83855 [Dictyostelium purpureum]|eukprot:XP_003293289.1 hypothetical protein DICPUDRAFT_83855 [Dictyostelium purpureum]
MEEKKNDTNEPTVGSKRTWTDVNYKFCKDEDKQSVEEIQTETSWDDVDWDTVREQTAKMMVEKETEKLSENDRDHHETNAMDYWDKFYKKNNDKFFKDRNYLHLEFPELNPLKLTRDQTFLFFDEGENTTKEEPLYQDQRDLEKQQRFEKERREKIAALGDPVAIKEGWNKCIKELTVDKNGNEINKLQVLEIGCGTGATVYPLLKLNPEKYFNVFDFSPHAVNLVKSNPTYNENQLKAFVCDIATEDLPQSIIKDNSIDLMLMIFVLSAISPEKMSNVANSLFKALKPGGILYVRDYGLYDMTQLRFMSKKGKKIDDNFYLRADGTRTYFFTIQKLAEIFEAAGFKTLVSQYDTRELRNRKKMISMYRVWVRGKFMKPFDSENSNNSNILDLFEQSKTPININELDNKKKENNSGIKNDNNNNNVETNNTTTDTTTTST